MLVTDADATALALVAVGRTPVIGRAQCTAVTGRTFAFPVVVARPPPLAWEPGVLWIARHMDCTVRATKAFHAGTGAIHTGASPSALLHRICRAAQLSGGHG